MLLILHESRQLDPCDRHCYAGHEGQMRVHLELECLQRAKQRHEASRCCPITRHLGNAHVATISPASGSIDSGCCAKVVFENAALDHRANQPNDKIAGDKGNQ